MFISMGNLLPFLIFTNQYFRQKGKSPKTCFLFSGRPKEKIFFKNGKDAVNMPDRSCAIPYFSADSPYTSVPIQKQVRENPMTSAASYFPVRAKQAFLGLCISSPPLPVLAFRLFFKDFPDKLPVEACNSRFLQYITDSSILKNN